MKAYKYTLTGTSVEFLNISINCTEGEGEDEEEKVQGLDLPFVPIPHLLFFLSPILDISPNSF
jgi:hypothetical protein